MRINEIFRSINGEVNPWGQGTWTTFVRLQGCNLRCPYCDTKGAQDSSPDWVGDIWSPSVVWSAVKDLNTPYITITGGEPLLQKSELKDLVDLITKPTVIETNGTYELPDWPVAWVIDYKLHIDIFNVDIQKLGSNDFIKFVICNKEEFFLAKRIYNTIKNYTGARFAFSPSYEESLSLTLAGWMEEEGLTDIVLNVQLHKLIGVK